ncbi:hypothetical protein [Caulobacter segnis]
MAIYTIQVWNQSKFAKSYVAFMQTPVITGRGGDPDIYTNAWATFPSLLDGGFDSITYEDVTYAYWGTAPRELAPNTSVVWGGVAKVNTTTQDTVAFDGSDSLGFEAVQLGGAMTGSYQITATTDFTADNNYVFGLARPGKTPLPTPVATFKAQPNDTFNITPVEKFYVADGAYTPGAVIDVSMSSSDFAEIDFTGKPQTTATVIQAANGSFSVVYS